MSNSYGKLFEGREIAIAKKLVEDFRRRWTCLEWEEFDDLFQECLICWHIARESYNPQRGASLKTFMARVLRNRLMDIVREMESDKRKVTRLSVPFDTSPDPDGYPSTPPEKAEGHPGTPDHLDPASGILMRIDLEKAIRRLDPRQKKLCGLLGEKGLTIQEASVILKTPRSTLCDEIKRIRAIFEKEGLNEYFR